MDIQLWKKRKKELHLTHDQLAELSGVSRRTIARIFSGKPDCPSPTLNTIDAIEKALGLSDTNWTAEDYENGVVDNMPVRITAEESQWLTYREEILRYGGQKDYEAVCVMIGGLIDKRMKEKNIKPITGD